MGGGAACYRDNWASMTQSLGQELKVLKIYIFSPALTFWLYSVIKQRHGSKREYYGPDISPGRYERPDTVKLSQDNHVLWSYFIAIIKNLYYGKNMYFYARRG